MTFAQLIEIVREWQHEMMPERARAATEDWARVASLLLGALNREDPHLFDALRVP